MVVLLPEKPRRIGKRFAKKKGFFLSLFLSFLSHFSPFSEIAAGIKFFFVPSLIRKVLFFVLTSMIDPSHTFAYHIYFLFLSFDSWVHCVDPLKYFQFCELKVYEYNYSLSTQLLLHPPKLTFFLGKPPPSPNPPIVFI